MTLYILIYFFWSIYIFIKKRPIDYITISYLGCSFYFLPGLFGEVGFLDSSGWIYQDILNETYFIMTLVISFCFIFNVIFDVLSRAREKNEFIDSELAALYSKVLVYISFISFFLLVISSGGAIFNADKAEVMEDLNRWHIVFYISAMCGLAISTLNKTKYLFIIFLSLLVVNLLIGFRSPLVIALMCVGVVYFKGKEVRLFKFYKPILIFILLAFSMFLFKYVAFAIKVGNWELVTERLYSSETYWLMIINSEPFVIMNNLNEVIKLDFVTPPDHIYSAIYNLIFFSPELGADIVSFNGYFQSSLFPTVDYGLASNIWAQFWSVYGTLGILMMILLFIFLLTLINLSLKYLNVVISAGISPAFCYFTFYIHRNDIGYSLNLSKRVFVVFLFSALIVYILNQFKSRSLIK